MKDFDSLEKELGVSFKNKDLLVEALTHRSYLNENKKIKNSNERLEFLGDSVLSLIISTEIFIRKQDLPEGELTSLRSALVRTKTLADLAKNLKLGDYLLMSKGEEKSGGRENTSLLADTFEAILGAVYLDCGLGKVRVILGKMLFDQIDEFSNPKAIFDYKSKYQEVVQDKNKISPVYKVIDEVGPDHNKIFTVGVYWVDILQAQGKGKSKQEAEQMAARVALQQFKM